MFELPFYYRYVDDIALAVPRDKSKEVLDLFNSVHPRLQLTLEIGGKSLNFLDVTIITITMYYNLIIIQNQHFPVDS